jgi:hypothetical protein
MTAKGLFITEVQSMFLSRRQFLKISVGTVAAVAVADKVLALTALQPVIEVGNPLGEYPDRSWERVYHDQYRYDSSFTWCCSPNDTHACRIRAFVRNGVVMRVEQNYDHQTYEDLYGNRGTFAHVLERLHVPPPGVRTLSVEGPLDAERLERLDGCGRARNNARCETPVQVRQSLPG